VILGALVIAAFIMVVPSWAADGIAAVRAAWTNDQKYLREDQERRRARTQRIADAWSHRRATRSLNAGGDGTYRAGIGAYIDDLYHGFFEDQLERSQVKRATRDPYTYDPGRPGFAERFANRVDAVIVGQAERLRRKREGSLPVEDFDDIKPTANPVDTGEAPLVPVVRLRIAWPPEPSDDDSPSPEQPAAAAPTEGAPAVSTGTVDVTTNEDVRNNAAVIAAAAAKMQEGLAIYEAARAEAQAAQAATADAMSGATFDGGAVAATADVGDSLDVAAMSHLAEVADNVHAGAQAMYQHVEKYRDAEDLVAQTGVSPETLAATSS
jgi:hypothetical protein